MEIRILQPAEAEALFTLRRQALEDAPLAFAASPEDDHAAPPDTVRQMLGRGPDSSVVFGAIDGSLIGMLGLYREPKRKMAHKVHFWGMYVRPEDRGRGVARALMTAALAHARTLKGVTQVQISATDDRGAASRLYEEFGFRVWGTEPDAIRHGGRGVSTLHMALSLNDGAAPPSG